jgi:hypothetical protein
MRRCEQSDEHNKQPALGRGFTGIFRSGNLSLATDRHVVGYPILPGRIERDHRIGQSRDVRVVLDVDANRILALFHQSDGFQ